MCFYYDFVLLTEPSQKNGITKLVSENEDYPDIEDEEQNLHFWGVVAKVIREY